MRFSQPPVIRSADESGDLGWVVMAHGEIYAREFGWGPRFEAIVARIVADYAAARDPRSRLWIAEAGGERVGSIGATPDDDPGVMLLRVLLVDPRARGHRLGDRLVETAIEFARGAGCDRVRLWTADRLAAARAIYLRHGFAIVSEAPNERFGVPGLIDQIYERAL